MKMSKKVIKTERIVTPTTYNESISITLRIMMSTILISYIETIINRIWEISWMIARITTREPGVFENVLESW
jgi:hypothetical protein